MATTAAGPSIKVLLVDDHPLVREGLRTVLEQEADLELIGEAATGAAALKLLEKEQPAVVLLDLKLPDAEGVEMVTRVRAAAPDAAIVVLTIYDSEGYLMGALQEGAAGYVLKDQPQEVIPLAIRAAAAGGSLYPKHILERVATNWGGARGTGPVSLSPRELAILKLVAQGFANKEIASQLNLAESTVKKYVQTMVGKLGAGDRGHAAVIGMRLGLVN